MNKIPTAEEILLKQGVTKSPISGLETYLKSNAKNAMIEFARLHVEAALKEANKKAIMTGYIDSGQTILNTYPLENIK